MTLVDIEAPQDKVKRNRRGQYLLREKGATKRTGWPRASNVAKAVSDSFSFEAHWKRTTLAGGHIDPELAARCHAALQDDNKAEAGRIAERAFALAGGNVKRDRGTLTHDYLECKLRDPDFVVPELYRAQIDAIIAAIKAKGFRIVSEFCEQIVLLDDLHIAGKLDLILHHEATDTYYVGDLKTGSVDFGGVEWCIQLHIYANADCGYVQGEAEDGSEDQRIDLPPLNRERAVIINAPLDTTDVHFYWLDISHGPELLDLCMKVRKARNLKSKVLTKIEGGGPTTTAVDGTGTANADDVTESVVVATVEEATNNATALDILHEARTAWLIRRTEHLVAALSKRHVAEVWPTDVPGPKHVKEGKHVWTAADIDCAAKALDALEAKHDVPFGDEDPAETDKRRKATEASLRAEAQRMADNDRYQLVKSAPKGSKRKATAEQVKTLGDIVAAMANGTPDERARIQRVQLWQRHGSERGVPWRLGDHNPVPFRIWAVATAAVGCADLIDLGAADPDGPVRDLLSVVLEDHDLAQQPAHDVGALIGLLTTEQALRLAEMAETATQEKETQA